MGQAVFHNYTTTAYNEDPIFKNKAYHLYGNPAVQNAPDLFWVDSYRYVLISPDDFKNNKELCFKVGAYLYHHKAIEDKFEVYTYFFGDINKCKEIGEEFENQICKYVSYEMLEEWYPKNLEEINDKFVNYFLAQQKYYGQTFRLGDYDMRYLLFLLPTLDIEGICSSKSFILKQLSNNGYISALKTPGGDYISFTLTATAIKQFQKTKNKENNAAFIAIKFKGNEERIKVIQDTIADCGYEPRIMSEYQTNEWIMPEIFHQIQLSKFVVVDFSLPCDGAYYEAGYAQALGKQVIHIYDKREEANNQLHFDVAQKSTVIYKDYDDLREKLTKRINATVK